MADEQQRVARFDRAPEDGWRYERFLTTIEREAGLDRDHAERAAMAVLTTLAERVSAARAQELAEDLPQRLRDWLLDTASAPEELRVAEFVSRVAEREEVDDEAARRHTRIVFRALARVAPAYEIDDLVEELPSEYDQLLGDIAREVLERTEPEIRSFDAFVEGVKRRADLDRLEAERAAQAVLETLAERLTPGEVEDLEAALPGPFREALERGRRRARGHPRKISLDEFVDRVAREERVSYDEAFEHIRAVFATLAEALAPKELRDILDQLPRGYRETLY